MSILLPSLAIFILAPGFAASTHYLGEITALDSASESFPFRIIGVDVERPETNVAEP